MPSQAPFALHEAMYTSRALRHFKPDPVPDELITQILDAAIRAATGGNTQKWGFVVVTAEEKRKEIGDLYRTASYALAAKLYGDRPAPEHLTDEQNRQFINNSAYLWDHMADAPVILVPCLELAPPTPSELLGDDVRARYDDYVQDATRVVGASIYPAVQNIILTCRSLGLGTVITTNHVVHEPAFKQVLGIPEQVGTFALMPIGYPRKAFGPVTRKPVNKVAFRDAWGTPWASVQV